MTGAKNDAIGELEAEDTQTVKSGRPVRPNKKSRPAPVRDDDSDAPLPAPAPVRTEPGAGIVPPKRPPVGEAFPDCEQCPNLTAKRAAYERLVAQWREAAERRDAAYARSGLRPGEHNPAAVERAMVAAIADGRTVEEADELDRLCRAERRLFQAAEIAAKEVEPALRHAVRARNDAVREKLRPTARALALAKIAVIKASAEHRQAVETVKHAGYVAEPLHIWGGSVPLDPAAAVVQLTDYVRLGVITQEELNEVAALPAAYNLGELAMRFGIPG